MSSLYLYFLQVSSWCGGCVSWWHGWTNRGHDARRGARPASPRPPPSSSNTTTIENTSPSHNHDEHTHLTTDR
ncbi:hypothetical protein M9458_034304, partial [Cirrhinus mrigala]